MVSTYTKNNQKEKRKKRGGAKAFLLSIFSDGAHMCPKATKKQKGNQIVLRLGDGAHLCLKTTKQKERKKKKRGVEAPPLLRLGDGAHLCPKEIKTKKRKKRGSSSFPFVETWPWCPKSNKKKRKKKGSWPLSKVGNGAHQNQNQNKKKTKKIKIGCLLLSSCFQTLRCSSSKLSILQALSSLNPNVKPFGDGVIAKGVWGVWVSRMKEVDGLVGGRVVGFRV